MSHVADYLCLHCKKWKSQHQANSSHCPIPSRQRSFQHFSATKVYEPNLKKPRTVAFTI